MRSSGLVGITTQLYALSTAVSTPERRLIDAAGRQIATTTYSMDRVRFVVTDLPDLVERVATTQADFAAATTRTLDLLSAGRSPDALRAQTSEVVPLAERLERLTDELINRAGADVAQGVVETRDAYVRSQAIVVAFAGASLVLALLLGLAIALSIIGPLRAIGARVERIEGDFRGHLQVENRDELGALAANVDRMSDHLGILYDQLETRAADDERLRLARDLHDLLGHGLSLITIKSQLARRLSGQGQNERAASEIADIERVARESLQDVRHAVDGYRQPSFTSALAGARAALTAAGIDSTVDVSGDCCRPPSTRRSRGPFAKGSPT